MRSQTATATRRVRRSEAASFSKCFSDRAIGDRAAGAAEAAGADEAGGGEGEGDRRADEPEPGEVLNGRVDCEDGEREWIGCRGSGDCWELRRRCVEHGCASGLAGVGCAEYWHGARCDSRWSGECRRIRRS